MIRHLRLPITVIAATVIYVMWFVAAAQAQMLCDMRDSVVAKLGDKYAEVRRGGGMAGPKVIFEIWASDATGTWTILQTHPDGTSCIMAVGNNWHDDVVLAGEGA